MADMDINFIVPVVIAYFIGAISFGIIASKLFGIADPRTMGSGNIGATNVARSGKKSAAIFTLLGDMLKGFLPVWWAMQMADVQHPWFVPAVGLAVFLGHLYPVYYGFKGGKGVATALGVMLGMSLKLGLAALGVWILVFAISRISSLSALVAAVAAPVIAYFLFGETSMPCVWLVVVMSAFLVWRHQSNIKKLLDGTEAGFNKK